MTDSQSELDVLKSQADLLGISYRDNIGEEALREKLRKAKADIEEVSPSNAIEAMRAECTKLIRCIVTPMDPMKKDYQGELFSVGNSLVSISKFVLFNEPYHVEQMLLDMIKEKKINIYTSKKDARGNDIRVVRQGMAYGIEVLPPLTEKELKDLAASQQARNSIE